MWKGQLWGKTRLKYAKNELGSCAKDDRIERKIRTAFNLSPPSLSPYLLELDHVEGVGQRSQSALRLSLVVRIIVK